MHASARTDPARDPAEQGTEAALEAHLRRRLKARIDALDGNAADRPTKQTYTGSCHCGAVQFEVDIDLAGETTRCNCSICKKSSFWKSVVAPGAFRILQGEDALADYQFGSRIVHHRFCRRCGVKPFAEGRLDGVGAFYAINLACLDDAAEEDLAKAPITYQDGRRDLWGSQPAETRHL